MDRSKAGQWRSSVIAVVLFLAFLAVAYYGTLWSMVKIWLRSDTFAHGFIIVPISLWLIWRKRNVLVNLQPQPDLRILVLAFGAGFTWLISSLVDVVVVRQLALISLLICGLWTLLGTRVVCSIAFPLAFLVFMVPFGEGLIPWMMGFTANFTVFALKLSGIPVYREGLFFSVPSGNWSVVEACSGIRYLIASITLGSLYAYLNYSIYIKRIIFIIISAIVPIIANGLRAYLIVMISHFSGGKLAKGVDHLIYGWIFFGIVMFVLFAIGSIWRDPEISTLPKNDTVKVPEGMQSPKKLLIASVGSLTLLLIWPAISALAARHDESAVNYPLVLDISADGIHAAKDSSWRLSTSDFGASASINRVYRFQNDEFGVHIYQFASQHQGSELVNSQNLLVRQNDLRWRTVNLKKRRIILVTGDVEVDQTLLKSSDANLLVWSWYRVGGSYTSNPYIAKALELWARLSFARTDSARIIVMTPVSDVSSSLEPYVQKLRIFIKVIQPEIEQALDNAAGVND